MGGSGGRRRGSGGERGRTRGAGADLGPRSAPADLDATVRACRERDITTEGVPTFLLLQDADAAVPSGEGRPDEEGAALGALAEGILDHLVGAGGTPGDRDVALALEVLAARHFSPGSFDLAAPKVSGAGVGEYSISDAFSAGRCVRAVNFHATPPRLAGRLEERIFGLAERFAPVSGDDLARLVSGGAWTPDKPGVVLSFYNGFRDNFEVAAPILERAGMTGWFFVVPGWVAAASRLQRDFARGHRIVLPPNGDLPSDGRLALSPGEVASLAERGHAVASHTTGHVAPAPELSPDALEHEVAGSRRELERMVGAHAAVRALAWHGGTALGHDPRADAALRSAGYELLFANHAVQRVR